jgi:hypothetical protein
MFRIYLSHLQALKGQIYTVSRTMHCGIPNAYNKLIVQGILSLEAPNYCL